MRVCWNNVCSESFGRSNGVRQGSSLPLFLYSYYANGMINTISMLGKGCKFKGVWINILAYADDMVLLTPAWSAMQDLLCQIEGLATDIDMVFNVGKTKFMIVKPKESSKRFLVSIPQLVLSGLNVDFCLEFKYLGHLLVESWDDAKDIGRVLKLLYIRTNKLIGKFSFRSDNVKKVL